MYVLLCADGSLYTGWTADLAARTRTHEARRGAKYTRSRLPVTLLAWWYPADSAAARSAEARFKRLTREGKLAVLRSRQAFGVPVHNAPLLFDADSHGETSMTTYAPPSGEEFRSLAERAATSQVRIVTNKGEIVFTFFADDAPMHSAAFIKLAEAGFYDGLTFHRVEPGFVVQGGDPSGNGTGGPGYRLPAEFNKKPHLRGTVAMARAANPDSAGSQFYICLDDAPFLNNQYTVFGQMSDGFETLDAIRVGDTMTTVTVEPKNAG